MTESDLLRVGRLFTAALVRLGFRRVPYDLRAFARAWKKLNERSLFVAQLGHNEPYARQTFAEMMSISQAAGLAGWCASDSSYLLSMTYRQSCETLKQSLESGGATCLANQYIEELEEGIIAGERDYK